MEHFRFLQFICMVYILGLITRLVMYRLWTRCSPLRCWLLSWSLLAWSRSKWMSVCIGQWLGLLQVFVHIHVLLFRRMPISLCRSITRILWLLGLVLLFRIWCLCIIRYSSVGLGWLVSIFLLLWNLWRLESAIFWPLML